MAAALPLEKLGLTDEQERAVIAATLGVLLDSLVDGGAVHEARGAQTHMQTYTHTCVCSYYIYICDVHERMFRRDSGADRAS
jgi:hypothetical protein